MSNEACAVKATDQFEYSSSINTQDVCLQARPHNCKKLLSLREPCPDQLHPGLSTVRLSEPRGRSDMLAPKSTFRLCLTRPSRCTAPPRTVLRRSLATAGAHKLPKPFNEQNVRKSVLSIETVLTDQASLCEIISRTAKPGKRS